MGGERSRSAGWWVVTASLVLVWGGVAAAVVRRPSFLPSPCGHNETAAEATLRSLASCQEIFRDARAIDLDGDGVGEYGLLQELAAAAGLRADPQGRTRGPALDRALLSPSLRPWARPSAGAPAPC